MMTHGSLFAGIGGFDLGFEWAGIETLWQVEIDEYCQKVLEKHWPDVERFKDIKDCGRHNLKEVDIISGGFPCQDISVAGKQAGIDGSRSGLWSEMYRIIGELRPRYAVIENVPNLLKLGLERVLTDLTEIGYDAEWQIIGANDVGAPHRRKRIWIIAYPQCNGNNKSMEKCGISIPGREKPGIGSAYWEQFELVNKSVAPSEWKHQGLGIDSRSLFIRMSDGLQSELDRLKGLGNAIVPQIAEIIGRRLKTLQ